MTAARNMKARRDAKAAGLKLYFTGSPCEKGHASEKYVSTGGCVECVRTRQADWQKRNKGKRREQYLRYKQSHLEETRERSRSWYRQNSEKDKIRLREHRAKIQDLITVLRAEMPELLKEFGLR